ncbi:MULTISPECIES: RNA methyltransferase [unclassified Bacillus (in: firmicutes)]|uniref:TrmH family RNA methyltransferase n=1 Tax=unclassified Bacillus (in: firmicutes) TaxID=185979 RepID=UPI001BE8024E|nr:MULTISPECIES: RNA methyltransferase [unclassified Bacillus (in: firmicutes)]MBT2638539.1 RNA methyltransferase [Bacillus sp. ISL-39]MBT2660545.1 RNA methyltransferase [Bacillus sp. ISL-45]
MKYIQSDKNPQVKQWKKLLTRKERDKSGMFLVEGFHLVEEALTKKEDVDEIILSEKTELPPGLDYGSISVTVVTDEISKQLADTETTQGIFAVCRQSKQTLTEGKSYLLIDSVQDPGNLGTMIRTADAAGIDAVVVGKGSVDMYNPKVLRSAQGSHFHLPVVNGDLSEWITELQAKNIPVYGTALENGVVYTEAHSNEAFALLVGNEGSGVNKELLEKTTQNLYIPLYGKSESLNVAVAAGILLYYLKTAK